MEIFRTIFYWFDHQEMSRQIVRYKSSSDVHVLHLTQEVKMEYPLEFPLIDFPSFSCFHTRQKMNSYEKIVPVFRSL